MNMQEILKLFSVEQLSQLSLTYRVIAVGGLSATFSGVYILLHKVNNNKFDTITDLKKKAKVFKDSNYKTKTNNKQGI